MPDSTEGLVQVPEQQASSEVLYNFALTFNAYREMAKDLDELHDFFALTVSNFKLLGQLEASLDVHFLRGLLFYLARTDHFVEGFWDTNLGLCREAVTRISAIAGKTVPSLQ